VVLPLMRPAIAALSVLIFTFIWNDYFWAIVLTQGPERAAGDGWDHRPSTASSWRLSPDERGFDRGRDPAGADVLPDATALHRRPDPWSREMTKLAFIGAGSTIFMKNIVGDMLHFEALRDAKIALDGYRPRAAGRKP
jgi:hypothetical protein